MPDEPPWPTHEALVEELRQIRAQGLAAIRAIKPPALTDAARLAGLATAEDAIPSAIEELIQEGCAIFGDSLDRDVAEFLFGLDTDWRMRPGHARRAKAAEQLGMRVETFRKVPERRLIAQVAEGVLGVARGRAQRSTSIKEAIPEPPETLKVPVGRLEGLSSQFAEDLDVVSVYRGEAFGVVKLSEGLYVKRERQDQILGALRSRVGTQLLITGDAGNGKSSLLWALHRELQSDVEFAPILVSATWLLSEPGTPAIVTLDEVIDAAAVKLAAGLKPVVLLDTADLLLHHETERLQVIELQRRLEETQTALALTARPREADQLATTALIRIELPPYNDAETELAVAALTRTYCPDAPVDDALAMVRSAMARGLPIAEVVRNPLTLRMWFENASPLLPSMEADVTSIYTSYWRTRVADDRRHFGRPTAAADYSEFAGALGIAMLGLGSPELTVDVAARHIAGAGADGTVGHTQAIDALVRRGVLVRQRGRIRFFHQTLFEFAAAEGLLGRDPVETIAVLASRMTAQPDDLFVAAVMEQYLILVAHDPAVAPAITECLGALLASDHAALQDLALVVWAHHPELDIPPELLADVPASALRRFTLVAPTVADIDVHLLVDRLAVIWERPDRSTRRDVLNLLARLAPRDPVAVARAMQQFDCVEYFLAEYGTGVATIIGIPAILEQIVPVAPERVQHEVEMILAVAIASTKSREMTIALLQVLARTWPILGSPELLDEVTALVVAGQENGDRNSREVREALGELLAAAWSTGRARNGGDWGQLVETVAQDVEADDESPRAGAAVFALARLMAEMPSGDERIEEALDRLWALKPPKAPWQPTRGAFAELLITGSPAAEVLADRIVTALEGLPASANDPAPGPALRAALARQTLDNPRIPHTLVAALLARRENPPETWLDDQGLLVLSASAAAGGLAEAREAILNPLRPHSEWPEREARILYGRLQSLVPEVPDFFTALLALAQRLDETAALRIYAKQGQCLDELTVHRDSLAAFTDRLLGGKPLQQRHGANLALDLERAGVPLWDSTGLRARCDSVTDAWARATMLELRGERALHDSTSISAVIDVCRTLIRVQTEPPTLLAAGQRPVPVVLMEAARTVWLGMLAAKVPDPADAAVATALALAPRVNRKTTAQPENPDAEMIDTSLIGRLAEVAVRFADRGATRVATQMVVATEKAAHGAGPTHDNQSRRAANRMRGTFRAIIRRGSTEDIDTLIQLAYGAQPAWGKLIVTTLATEGLARFRDRLLALLRDPNLPPSVASQIHTELKSRARVAGAGQFTEILAVPNRTS